MKNKRIKELKAKGWEVGDIEDFLGLTPEEVQYIEMKLALSSKIQEVRKKKGLSQVQAAEITSSSQSRFSKMETGDSSVSVDLQIKSLLLLGATKDDTGFIKKFMGKKIHASHFNKKSRKKIPHYQSFDSVNKEKINKYTSDLVLRYYGNNV